MRNNDDSNINVNSDAGNSYDSDPSGSPRHDNDSSADPRGGRQYRSRAKGNGSGEEEGGLLSSAASLLSSASSLINGIGKHSDGDNPGSSVREASDGILTDDAGRTNRAASARERGVSRAAGTNRAARTGRVFEPDRERGASRAAGTGHAARTAQAADVSRAYGTGRASGVSPAADAGSTSVAGSTYGSGRAYGAGRTTASDHAAGTDRSTDADSTYGSSAAGSSRAAGASRARTPGSSRAYGSGHTASSHAYGSSAASHTSDVDYADYTPAYSSGLNEASFFDDAEHENDVRRTRARSRLIRERRAAQRRISVASSLSILAIFAAVCFLGFTGTDTDYSAAQGQNSSGNLGIISNSDPINTDPGDNIVPAGDNPSGNVTDSSADVGNTDDSSLAGLIGDTQNPNGDGQDGQSGLDGYTGIIAETIAAEPDSQSPAEDSTLPQDNNGVTGSQTTDQSTQNVGSLLKNDALPVDKSNSDKVTILSAGDNLIHSSLIEGAKTADGYDFSSYYAKVKDIISAADIATVNQEAPIASSIAEPSGYPIFNTPEACGNALIEAGFDVFNLANNHVTDLGEAGVEATLNYCDSKDITSVGMYRNTTDRAMVRTINKNGIRVALLGFLDTSNVSLPEDTAFRWTKISWESQVQEIITKAKSEADIVVVHAHWGDEDEFYQTPLMKDMAQKMVNWGADVIYGSHPHVLQKLVFLKREGTDKQYPVIYSLGNFISGQQNGNKLVSGLLQVTAYRDRGNGATMVDDIAFYPIVTHYTGNRKNLCLYPVSEYSEELAAAHGVHEFDSSAFNMNTIKRLIFDAIPSQYVVGVTP